MFRPLALALALVSVMAGNAVAALQLYPIEAIKNLPEIDDGTGPLKFDFSPYKIATRYDGANCAFTIERFDENGEQPLGTGEFTVKEGRLAFTRAEWFTGGLATPDSYNRANLALTEKGELVGKLPVFHLFVDTGMVPPDAVQVTFTTKGGKLAKDVPAGTLLLEIERGMKGKFDITGCNAAGVTGPIQPYFDFTKYKLATTYDGLACSALFVRHDADGRLQPIGNGHAAVSKGGHVVFSKGYWNTRGPKEAFNLANLAVTSKGTLVGQMMVYPLFPDPGGPIQRGFPVTLTGEGGKLSETLAGKTVFPLDDMEGQLIIGGCKPAT